MCVKILVDELHYIRKGDVMDVKELTRLQMTNVVKKGKEYYRVVYRENDVFTLSAMYSTQDSKTDRIITISTSNCKDFKIVN